jgi:putative spermidine/putrescine transport system ATP-binding protein
MDNSSPLVRFVGVSKSYDGKRPVIAKLDLDINHGEFLTLLGPSGSGKTTCLMMLAGFEVPNSGQIYIDGRNISNVPAYKRNIGIVFQNYALFPHMSVADNIGFPLRQRKMPAAEIGERVAKVLDLVQLENLGDRFPKQLSGGQQQRVALARAIVFEPRVILMDEPLGALDRRLREQLQLEIKLLHGRIATTIVYVTHDQNEALTMSDRIAVFNNGVVEQIDTPENIYERPATRFVAHFVGQNNSLPGVVESVCDGVCSVRLSTGEVAKVKGERPCSPGQNINITVRPERFVVGDNGAGTNRVRLEVIEAIYNGDQVLLPCRLGDGSPVQLRLSVASSNASLFRKGEIISASWAVEDGRGFALG